MSAISLFLKENNGASFTPATIEAMSLAFDEICDTLQLTETAKYAREVVALRIIDLARCGEHDPRQLRERALLLVGIPAH